MASYSQQLSRLAALFGGNQNSYGLPLANRNYIVDGNMESTISASAVVAAAGTSSGVATMYYVTAGATNGGTLATNAAPWTLGTEPIGMTSPVSNVLTWTQASAPTSAPAVYQRVENVQTLQNRAATFSCWLWCASGTQTVTNVQMVQNFGAGGSPSANVTTNVAVNWVLTTTPQRFSVLLSVPSIVGKTLGTAGSYLQAGVQYPASGTYAINTAQWQLEQSSPNAPAAGMPTAFEYRGQQAEAARVQRYYFAPGSQFNLAGQGTGTIFVQYHLPVPMRVIPAITASWGSGINATSGSFRFGDSKTAESSITNTASGAYSAVVTWTSFDARL